MSDILALIVSGVPLCSFPALGSFEPGLVTPNTAATVGHRLLLLLSSPRLGLGTQHEAVGGGSSV